MTLEPHRLDERRGVLELTSGCGLSSAANWLKPPGLDQRKQHHTPRYLTRAYWHNNSRKLLFLCTYSLFSLLLFISAMLQHRHGGGWYMVAKGCGQCLNFNCTFVMVAASALSSKSLHQISDVRRERCWCVQVLMLRRCLTWLRATWVVRVLPLDQNILLHQIVGYAILFYTLLHTSAHIFNFGTDPPRGDRCGSA